MVLDELLSVRRIDSIEFAQQRIPFEGTIEWAGTMTRIALIEPGTHRLRSALPDWHLGQPELGTASHGIHLRLAGVFEKIDTAKRL